MDPYDPEELLVCPYDPVHRVARKRMQIHLVKCSKNYNTKPYLTCPFNAEHVIPRPEFKFHISQCPNRGNIEVEMFREDQVYKQKGYTKMPEQTWDVPQAEESWDDDNVKYEPKLPDELFNQDPVVIKKKKNDKSKPPVPPPVEEVRMPHSFPMAGLKTTTRIGQGAEKGRGRGRGLSGRLPKHEKAPITPGYSNNPAGTSYQRGEPTLGKVHQQGASPFVIQQGSPLGYYPNYGRGNPFACGIGRGFAVPPPANGSYVEGGLTTLSINNKEESKAESPPPPLTKGTPPPLTKGTPPPLTKGTPGVNPVTCTKASSNKEDDDVLSDEGAKRSRTIRKLRKMLRQVEEIEKKQAAGAKLTPEQVAKLNRKQEIVEQLVSEEDGDGIDNSF